MDTHCRGRFAPSPTGELHAGSLVTALASWLHARQASGQWLVRMEDIDPPRERSGAATSILHELARLGLTTDVPVLYQSTREAAYQQALDRLHADDHVFPCWCTRRDLAQHSGLHRDGHCVTRPDQRRTPTWRLRVPDTRITFDDGLQCRQEQNLRNTVGDFVLRRADGLWSYQLACVVDDAVQNVTEVIRGMDLMVSTARQIYLQQLLSLPTPRYFHLPLITDAHGRKLSKSNADPSLREQPATALLHRALALLGMSPDRRREDTPAGLLEHAITHFDIQHLAGCQTLTWPKQG